MFELLLNYSEHLNTPWQYQEKVQKNDSLSLQANLKSNEQTLVYFSLAWIQQKHHLFRNRALLGSSITEKSVLTCGTIQDGGAFLSKDTHTYRNLLVYHVLLYLIIWNIYSFNKLREINTNIQILIMLLNNKCTSL